MIEATVKKWGNSVGIVFPKDFVNSSNIKIDDKIFVNVIKKGSLKNIFGTLEPKTSAQEFKDMVREGWK